MFLKIKSDEKPNKISVGIEEIIKPHQYTGVFMLPPLKLEPNKYKPVDKLVKLGLYNKMFK